MPPLSPGLHRPASPGGGGTAPLVIGLVNNMPDGALRATERQFRTLLTAAAGERPVSLRIFSLPGLARSTAGRQHVDAFHEPIEALWNTPVDGPLDGLIVTGSEPRAALLEHEPFWPALTELIDWADANTTSTVWSCLAAHAAVRHLDGVTRRRLPSKLSGVFDTTCLRPHPLIGFGLSHWCTPHSRYNDLAESDLAACGYRVLARSREAGVDLFVKQRRSLFVFLQSHPEYEPGTLLREYRRDVVRFLIGERDEYPPVPCGYFGPEAAEAMRNFEARARRERDPELLASFPADQAMQTLTGPWCAPAVRLFANWLHYLAEQRGTVTGWPHSQRAAALTTGGQLAPRYL